MNYKAYAKESDTESRKTRKGLRLTVFVHNKQLKRNQKRDARRARKEEL